MFKNLNRCDVYIIITLLYLMQGILYPQGIINQFLQFVQIAIAGVETLNVLTKKYQPPVLKIAFMLLLMYCVYGLWIIISDPIITYSDGRRLMNYVYLQRSLKSLLPIFMFYYYTNKGLLNEKRIRIYTVFFLAMSLMSFFQNKHLALAESDREEITNNAAYGFVNLIPSVYFFRKKPIFQYLLLGILGVFMLMGMKRGAILIGGLSIIILLYSNLKGLYTKRKVISIVLSISFLLGAIYYVTDLLQTSDYLVQRIEQTIEGNSSGRDIIYASLWNTITSESNPVYFLFGHGANGTIDLIGIEAHNDWLETLINNGFIGGLILLVFFLTIVKTAFKQRRRFPTYMYYSFLLLLLIMFSKTLFSMSIQSIGTVHTMLLGYFTYWSTRPKEELQTLYQ